MDILRETILTLQADEKKEFRSFIQRQRYRNERKDLELFELLDTDRPYKAREIASRLYQPVNMNAYHTLRKRLTKHLLEFVVLKGMDVDTTSESAVLGMLGMAQFMLARNETEIAGRYLQKAADLARKNEQFELLNRLLGLQIQHAVELQLDLTDLIPEWQQNKRLADLDQRATLAYSIIRQKLKDSRLTGSPEELSAITEDTIREFGLNDSLRIRPSFMYRVAQITRSAVIATKEYHHFEPYVIDVYTRILDHEGFAKKDHVYHLWFLYMICHVLYRNRNFEETSRYLDQFDQQLNAFNAVYYNRFYPKYVMLKAAVQSYSGHNQDGIDLLEQSLENEALRLDTADRLNMSLNLAVYYFQAQSYKRANQVLLNLNHTDHWMEKKMGKEWRFKKNLIEIIIQIELGNTEIALNRIRSVERYFGGFLKTDMYQRAHIFIRVIRAVLEKPEVVGTEEFAQFVDDTITRLPGDREDIQAMTFYCWLKSKMLKRDYYEVLIETIREFGKDSRLNPAGLSPE